jgi:hypothetical protein
MEELARYDWFMKGWWFLDILLVPSLSNFVLPKNRVHDRVHVLLCSYLWLLMRMSSVKSCCNQIFGGNKKRAVGDCTGTQWNQSQCSHLLPFNHSFSSSFLPQMYRACCKFSMLLRMCWSWRLSVGSNCSEESNQFLFWKMCVVFASIGAKAGERGGEASTDHSSSWTTRSHTSQGTSLLACREKVCESNKRMKCTGLSYQLWCPECASEFWEGLWWQQAAEFTCSKERVLTELGAAKVSSPGPLLNNQHLSCYCG